jgi:hypothetical protein
MVKKMNLRRFYKWEIVVPVVVFVLMLLIAGLYQIYILRIAHSSFENYYKFRGCVQLLEKTDTYGTCKISSGETIKIVEFQGKWYLDGDLPYPGLNFL